MSTTVSFAPVDDVGVAAFTDDRESSHIAAATTAPYIRKKSFSWGRTVSTRSREQESENEIHESAPTSHSEGQILFE
jgi:hypothetical protein